MRSGAHRSCEEREEEKKKKKAKVTSCFLFFTLSRPLSVTAFFSATFKNKKQQRRRSLARGEVAKAAKARATAAAASVRPSVL